MDEIGQILAPHSERIGQVAGAVTFGQFLSGLFLLQDVRRKGSSDSYPPEPFIGGCVLALLSWKMGSLMDDSTMMTVNSIGAAISIVFLTTFYRFASLEFKVKIWSKIIIATIFVLTVMTYAFFEDPEKIEFRFGLLITGMLIFLVGLPLLSLGDVIKRKSTEGMPFAIIFTGTIVSASWALYGISIKNEMLAYQNLFLFLLSAIQLSLFAIYPNTGGADFANSNSTLLIRQSTNNSTESSIGDEWEYDD